MAKKADTGDRIREAAHGMFMQYGLRSVSMDDIANSLGISKKTVYRFYADKDALVDDVIASIIEHNQLCCQKDKEGSLNAIHEIFLAMDFMMEIFQSMNPSLLFDMQKYYPGAFRRFSEHKNDYLQGMIKTNILRGIEEELYRSDIKVEILSRFRVESMMLPFNPEFQSKVKSNLAVVEEELILHFLFGMVTLKGYKMTTKYQQDRIKNLKANEKQN